MKNKVSLKKKPFYVLLNLLFYLMLLVLICALVYPYTSLRYRKPIIQPFGERLNRNDVTLVVGEGFHLYVNGLNKRVTYSSSDFKVATVDLNGNVRAWRKGTAIIRVKTKKKTLKCRVKVVDGKD